MFPPANIEVVPDVFECPVFDPFWSPPVNVVGIILIVFGWLAVAASIATSTVSNNKVFADRVEVTFLGGARKVVPLHAVLPQGKDNPKVAKHELAGIPPLRDSALQIKTREVVSFPGASGAGKSTRQRSDLCARLTQVLISIERCHDVNACFGPSGPANARIPGEYL